MMILFQGRVQIPLPLTVHGRQPMIAATVNYFLGKRANPCCGEDGAEVMRIMDSFVKNDS